MSRPGVRCLRPTTARSTRPCCGSRCCTTPGAGACRRPRSSRCCRRWRPRWAGSARYGDADGDGFLEYIDESGRGLANQGWKDSGDSIRFRTGEIATAADRAGRGAGLRLRGRRCTAPPCWTPSTGPAATRWRDYADAMAARFRDTFWVDGPAGAHPALALDGDKRPVDALTSNIGHLLGTGLLTREGVGAGRRPAGRRPAMAGGFGLRTMSTHDAAFSPLSYHCGSVWAHDTAIVIDRPGPRRPRAPRRRPWRDGPAGGGRGVRLPAARAVRRRRPRRTGPPGPLPGGLPPAGLGGGGRRHPAARRDRPAPRRPGRHGDARARCRTRRWAR